MKIGENTKVACCCEQGQVRSVAVRHALHKLTGNGNILACGLRKNNAATLTMLFEWADVILVCGEIGLLDVLDTVNRRTLRAALGISGETCSLRAIHIDLGVDVWGHPFAEDLLNKAKSLLAPHVQPAGLDAASQVIGGIAGAAGGC